MLRDEKHYIVQHYFKSITSQKAALPGFEKTRLVAATKSQGNEKVNILKIVE